MHVAILPAITEAERAALAALPPWVIPDAETLTRPAVLTASGAIVELSAATTPVRREDSFQTVDLASECGEPRAEERQEDAWSVPHPVKPALRPWLADECDSPSPIMLSSPLAQPPAPLSAASAADAPVSVAARIAHWEGLARA